MQFQVRRMPWGSRSNNRGLLESTKQRAVKREQHKKEKAKIPLLLSRKDRVDLHVAVESFGHGKPDVN